MATTRELDTPAPIDQQEFNADPLATLARHRANSWWAPLGETGIKEVLSYEAVRELLATDASFRACLGAFLEQVVSQNPDADPDLVTAMREVSARSLINLDGPVHQRLRALVSRNFTPRSVARLRPYIGEYAAELAEDLRPGDDFMRSFARDLPARALCALTGIPSEDHDRFIEWVDILEIQLAPPRLRTMSRAESQRVLHAQRELQAYCIGLVQERRANPRDDLLSQLATDSETDVDDGAIATLVSDLIFAGNDTTRNALGLMLMALAEQPDTWEALAEDPALAPSVVEEVLRLHSPAPGPVRQVLEETAYRDQTFDPGNIVILSIWSANRDRLLWGESADAFDAGREHAGEHLTFGHGPHFCLGAGLAREEMRAALVALTSQLTDLWILERPPMHPPGSIYGPVSLRIAFERR